MKPVTPLAKNLPPGLAPLRGLMRSLQSTPGCSKQIASDSPFFDLMSRGAFGRGVIEDDQAVDGNPCSGIDEKRIDVDRGDPASRVRHHVGQAAQRLYDGSFMECGLAAVTS